MNLLSYWNETNDLHLRLWDAKHYKAYVAVKQEINEEGYRGDKLQPTNALYLGTCDVMSCFLNAKDRWCNILHEIHDDSSDPLIALGSVGVGFPTMIRRLHAFIQNFGTPGTVYMTLPRFDGVEYVNESGQCYNASSRLITAFLAQNSHLVSEQEAAVWIKQLDTAVASNNNHRVRYLLEERFAFLRMMQLVHGFNLRWTFNPTRACLNCLGQYIHEFPVLPNWVFDSFVGYPTEVELLPDDSVAPITHRSIAERFLNPEPCNRDEFVSKGMSLVDSMAPWSI